MSQPKFPSVEQLAEDYTNSDYFRLEYSTFGTTAKECQKAFLAGYKACEERDRDLKDDIYFGDISSCREKYAKERGTDVYGRVKDPQDEKD